MAWPRRFARPEKVRTKRSIRSDRREGKMMRKPWRRRWHAPDVERAHILRPLDGRDDVRLIIFIVGDQGHAVRALDHHPCRIDVVGINIVAGPVPPRSPRQLLVILV